MQSRIGRLEIAATKSRSRLASAGLAREGGLRAVVAAIVRLRSPHVSIACQADAAQQKSDPQIENRCADE